MKDKKICVESNRFDNVFLNDAMDQLVMENGVCWYGHVLRSEDGHILRKSLDL